ncbi:hypothetical protein BdWA1_003225 [Babesia duncani]|uniref:Uncharacterized protein n=1 Tax=Babesia duncani TaxID=323732 RepID=A0AAD9UN53_9APIC|nr:hypothetical protein BdWA1_003225 [Babesia duncani]
MGRRSAKKSSKGFFEQLMNTSISISFGGGSASNARERQIAECNRQPSIYEPSFTQRIGQNWKDIPQTVMESISGFIQSCNDRKNNEETMPVKQGHVSPLRIIQRALCYAGAGIGIVGIGLVSTFGICAAAVTACSVVYCNKRAMAASRRDQNLDENEILTVPNYMQEYYAAPQTHMGMNMM